MTTPDIRIPSSLLPVDGRFGCGPSKVRPEAVAALAAAAPRVLGTSHRQDTVKNLVGALRSGLRSFFDLPDGYEVVLGNGGATLFWDAATFSLMENRSQHVVFGEFSSKFAEAAKAAPHLGEPTILESVPGTQVKPKAEEGIDAYCLVHNETSTGVAMTIDRPEGTSAANGELVLVDATSGAGGLTVDPTQFDCYYFAPQKCFASDGGLWTALCSPAAQERITRLAKSGRWIPASLDLAIALDNSTKNQTYNTPALATLFLFEQQVAWMNEQGGLAWASARCGESASIIYSWADTRSFASPFVAETKDRSNVVATIDLDGVDALTVSAVLRANGVVDTDSYRKLGRNQLRIALFPAIEPSDVAALTACIDYVVEHLA